MNRRSLLTLFGLAPVAGAIPAPALAGRGFATGGLVRGKEYVLGQAASELSMPLRGEVLTMQIDEGMVARTIRAELARHGIHAEADLTGFIEGDGI